MDERSDEKQEQQDEAEGDALPGGLSSGNRPVEVRWAGSA